MIGNYSEGLECGSVVRDSGVWFVGVDLILDFRELGGVLIWV